MTMLFAVHAPAAAVTLLARVLPALWVQLLDEVFVFMTHTVTEVPVQPILF